MTLATPLHSARPRLDDDRGAVMVIGVVMGALLVGALYHVIGIGNAAMWRERAQDAADAGAFENAVWHARGMNMIVALNMIMQVIMAVLVVWRILLLIAGVVVLLSGILCAATLGFGCGFAAEAANVANRMRSWDKPIAENIMRILGAMRISQTVVSAATPALGAALTSGHVKDAYPAVNSAKTWSASLLPSLSLETERDIQTCFLGKSHPKHLKKSNFTKGREAWDKFGAVPRISVPVSLPVQAGEQSLLCQKAGELVTEALSKALSLAHLPGGGAVDKAKGIVGKVVGSVPAYFCSPMSGGTPDELTDQIGGPAKDACGSEIARSLAQGDADSEDAKYRRYNGGRHSQLVTKKEWMKDCMKDKVAKAGKELGTATEEKDVEASACSKPAKVWMFAANGNAFLRSFSSIEQNENRSAHDGAGIDFADGARTGGVTAVQTGSVGAHAEMYFDCETAWAGCLEEAMWDVRWKARLRRVQPLGALARNAGERVLVEQLTQLAVNGLGGFLDWALHDKAHVPLELVPEMKDTWYFSYARGKLGEGIYGEGGENSEEGGGESSGFQSIQAAIVENGSKNSVIH